MGEEGWGRGWREEEGGQPAFIRMMRLLMPASGCRSQVRREQWEGTLILSSTQRSTASCPHSSHPPPHLHACPLPPFRLDGGFLTFLLPLILDSTLNRIMPSIFSPNVIASLQNEKRSFTEVRGEVGRVDLDVIASLQNEKRSFTEVCCGGRPLGGRPLQLIALQ